MAGSNVVLKEEQVLFSEGDSADGMYLIRRGELVVYLTKDDNEVKLASIGPGGMIGEMAFFDKKPRSASVKAGAETEVTKITPEDFAKLMKQIPKWFVSIMTSLSTRLRETNDRLQKLENKNAGSKDPFEDMTKMLHVLFLIWHKEGTKQGKYWSLNRGTAEKEIISIFGCEPEWVKEVFDTLMKEKFFNSGSDNYKNTTLAINNKGMLNMLANFITEFIKAGKGKSLPSEAIELLEAVYNLAKESAYDAVNIAFDDVLVEGERCSYVTGKWKSYLPYFKTNNDALSLCKVSSGVGFKVNKDMMPKFIDFHRIMAALDKAGLS